MNIISEPKIIFDDAQLQAISQTKGPVMILSCAGAGKTTAIVKRMERIIKSGLQRWICKQFEDTSYAFFITYVKSDIFLSRKNIYKLK